MSNFAEHFAEDRRLVILKVIEGAPGYTANEFILQATLARFGHSVPLDRIRTDLAWLAEQDLVTVSGAKLNVATATPRGLDVAAGRATLPGVKRPQPGDS